MAQGKPYKLPFGFGILFFVGLFLGSIYFLISALRSQLGVHNHLTVAIWASVFLAFVTPIAIIMIRHEVRLSRIKLIEVFADTFNFAQPSQQAGLAQIIDPKSAQNVSFEFVKGKYFADLDVSPNKADVVVPRFPMLIRSDWMMVVCAVPFMVIVWFGSFILFAPLIEVLKIGPSAAVGSWLWPNMLTLGGADINTIRDPAQFELQHVNVLTVMILAFAGGYFFSLRLLLRAVAVFDLSPVTFLRCFVHILLAMLLAVVIYRVFPSGEGFSNALARTGQALQTLAGAPPLAPAPAVTTPTPAPRPTTPVAGAPAAPAADPTQPAAAPTPAAPAPAASPTPAETTPAAQPATAASGVSCPADRPCPATGAAAGVSAIWLIIAFALGFIPDAALQFVLQKSGLTFKERYADLDPHAKLVPVTVIDGIDNFIAFRLEEANIFDVQNLATANPIMMHIESPFGIYETIDWVAQAQLCTVAGPDRFLMLKTLNIRTIFDLERAVMKPVVRDTTVETLIDRAAAAAAQAAKARAQAHAAGLKNQAARDAEASAKAAVPPDPALISATQSAATDAADADTKASAAAAAATALADASAKVVNQFVTAAQEYSAIDPTGAGRVLAANLLPPPPPPVTPPPPPPVAPTHPVVPPFAGPVIPAALSAPAEPGDEVIKIIGQLLVRDNARDSTMRTALNLGAAAYPGTTEPSVETVRHMVTVMLDDLHVHRLRQVWKHIARQLGDTNSYL
jgi:hypothetical protein